VRIPQGNMVSPAASGSFDYAPESFVG